MTGSDELYPIYQQPQQLETAADILQERGSRYGKFMDQAAVSVALKKIMQTSPNWNSLSPDQREALEMNCVKASRILVGDPNYVDNWRDIEGYAKLVADRLEREIHEF